MFMTLYVLFPNVAFAQIKVDKAGDGWDLQVDSALNLIKTVDAEKYLLVENVCQEISFWINTFSSSSYQDGNGLIYISTEVIRLNSINNLAITIVHESMHLRLRQKGVTLSQKEEENLCYRYELEFINKLIQFTDVEPWVINHTQRMINDTAQ